MYGPSEPQEPREDTPVVKSVSQVGETPREDETPRGGHTVSTMSEEESVSEWELERQKVSCDVVIETVLTFIVFNLWGMDTGS